LSWRTYFVDELPPGVNGLLVDVKSSCGKEFTYSKYRKATVQAETLFQGNTFQGRSFSLALILVRRISMAVLNGPDAAFFGEGDLHSARFSQYGHPIAFAEKERYDGIHQENLSTCEYTKTVYPTDTFQSSYTTSEPAIFAAAVVLVFAFTSLAFLVYDFAVQRRNNRMVRTAARTTAIVASIFPQEVQNRILQEAEERERKQELQKHPRRRSKSAELQEFLRLGKSTEKNAQGEGKQETPGQQSYLSKPLADFFPGVTIMFADLVGFTAWSSTREPPQVFLLLESIFHEFDMIAKRRRGTFFKFRRQRRFGLIVEYLTSPPP
jgi:hypothetical protein